MLGHPEQLQYHRHQRGQHHGAEHRQHAAGWRARPRAPVRSATGMNSAAEPSGAATIPASSSAASITELS